MLKITITPRRAGALLCAVLLAAVVPAGLGQAQGTQSGAGSAAGQGGDEMARDYYVALAKKGQPYAQLTLGDMYRDGRLVERDDVEAYAWYAVAAEQGVEEAVEPMKAVRDRLDESQQAAAKERAALYKKRYAATAAQ